MAVPDPHVIDGLSRQVDQVMSAFWVQPSSVGTVVLTLACNEETARVLALANTVCLVEFGWFRDKESRRLT